MKDLYKLCHFNKFMADRYDFSERDEVLLDVLSNQLILSSKAGGFGKIHPDNAEILHAGTRQILELFGEAVSPALSRMIFLNSGGHYVTAGPGGAPLRGEALASMLGELIDDYEAFLWATLKGSEHSLDIMLFTQRLMGILEHVPVTLEDQETLPLLVDVQKSAMAQIAQAFPAHSEGLLCIPAARSVAAIVKAYIDFDLQPAAQPIDENVWPVLTVDELSKLCRDPNNLFVLARATRDRDFALSERIELMETCLYHESPYRHTLFLQWLDVLPIDTLCSHLPLMEDQSGHGVPISALMATLRHRSDISDKECIRALMMANDDVTEVNAIQRSLELEHDVLSHMILTSEWPLTRLSAHVLLHPADIPNTSDSSSLQLHDTYLDSVMKPANLDLFAERAADGRCVGERVMEALEQLGLCEDIKGCIDIAYGSKWSFALDNSRSVGHEIMQGFTERFLKQQERLLRRDNKACEVATRADAHHTHDIL